MPRNQAEGTIEVAGETFEINKKTLPDVRSQTQNGTLPPVVAIAVSDLHLGETAPAARSAEKDWWEVQRRALLELLSIRSYFPNVPILYAGDIFNKWNPRPEVINFAIEYLPHGYAVPGNHDLPYHDYDLIKKSGYWTLVKAGIISNVSPEIARQYTINYKSVVIYGFPHGFKINPRIRHDGDLHIALVHQYIWSKGNEHKDAPESGYFRVAHTELRYSGFDVGIFGDNHKGFYHTGLTSRDGPRKMVPIFNCGTFLCRNTDERNDKPRVGLIHVDGTVSTYFMDTSLDRWTIEDIAYSESSAEMSKEVLDSLSKMSEASIDFQGAIQRYMAKTGTRVSVKEIILQAMETDG
jgi:DNA repair exonuclease SbcCD nuclease subunit